jgi:hypothetical protein
MPEDQFVVIDLELSGLSIGELELKLGFLTSIICYFPGSMQQLDV